MQKWRPRVLLRPQTPVDEGLTKEEKVVLNAIGNAPGQLEKTLIQRRKR
jgi:hypothetical protein